MGSNFFACIFLARVEMKDVRDTNAGTQVQMACVGPQDAWISADPQFSFFEHGWDRHGAFASTPTPVTFPTFRFGEPNRVEIPRSGDVLGAIIIEIRLPPGIATRDAAQNKSFLRRARLLIDDCVVQDFEGLWFDILEKIVHARRRELMKRPTGAVYLPLRFVHNLPLVALWRSRVYMDVELAFPGWLRALRVSPGDVGVSLLCDFVDVDAAQRAVLLNTTHTIMYSTPKDVDAVSYEVALHGKAPKKHVRLDLSECNVPAAFFAVVAYAESDRSFAYQDAIESMSFQIDGVDQFEPRPASYFQMPQLYQHSSSTCPADTNVHVYSFGLRLWVFAMPGQGQGGASGTMNLAGVHRPSLVLTMAEPLRTDLKIKAFVSALNWLHIEGGFAAPVFS
jgi:hypothetical protein